jgi:hypothetical protein
MEMTLVPYPCPQVHGAACVQASPLLKVGTLLATVMKCLLLAAHTS